MSRFPDTAVVSLPAGAKTLIAEVAHRRSMLPAQYMRTAVIEKLQADGADPTTTTTTTAPAPEPVDPSEEDDRSFDDGEFDEEAFG